MLWCRGEHETALVLIEVHQRARGSHIDGRALTHKILRPGYYWPHPVKRQHGVCHEMRSMSETHQLASCPN